MDAVRRDRLLAHIHLKGDVHIRQRAGETGAACLKANGGSAHVSCHIDASVSAGTTACWRNAFVLAPAVSVHEFVLIGAHRQRYGQLINTVPVRVQHLSGGWIPVASKTPDGLKVTGHMHTAWIDRFLTHVHLEGEVEKPCSCGIAGPAAAKAERHRREICRDADGSVALGTCAGWVDPFPTGPIIPVDELEFVAADREIDREFVDGVLIRIAHNAAAWIPIRGKASELLEISSHMDPVRMYRLFPHINTEGQIVVAGCGQEAALIAIGDTGRVHRIAPYIVGHAWKKAVHRGLKGRTAACSGLCVIAQAGSGSGAKNKASGIDA